MSKANGFVASAAICIPKATSEDSSSIVTECHQYSIDLNRTVLNSILILIISLL